MPNDSLPSVLVLVVDDEAVLRLIAADVLEEYGFQVLEAEDAKTALQLLADHPDVRVLFTDVNMPGALDGLGLARVAHAQWPGLALVITSGRPRPSDAEMPDGGRLLPKPYSPHTMVAEIREALVGLKRTAG